MMNIEDFNIGGLIQPVDPEVFFAEHWEKQPLHIQRRDPNYYQNLLSQQDLENIISSGDMRYPAIKLVPRGSNAFYRPETYTTNFKHGSDVFSGIPDVAKVFAEYRAGNTVALSALDLTWQPLDTICRALEDYFDHAVRANAYLTAGNTQGFTPHHDPHEVFVLQIAGRKSWSVYEPALALPLVNQPFGGQPFARNYTPPPPLLEPELEAGDLLYLPRGYVHAAKTSDSFSAHVTIGITVYTWVDLAAEVFMSCMNMEEFRRALPPGFASHSEFKHALRDGLTGLLEKLQNECDYDKVINNFTNRVLSGRRQPHASFQCDVSVANNNESAL
jgi:ribosomal protein L16 Arg81 hydroxylase